MSQTTSTIEQYTVATENVVVTVRPNTPHAQMMFMRLANFLANEEILSGEMVMQSDSAQEAVMEFMADYVDELVQSGVMTVEEK